MKRKIYLAAVILAGLAATQCGQHTLARFGRGIDNSADSITHSPQPLIGDTSNPGPNPQNPGEPGPVGTPIGHNDEFFHQPPPGTARPVDIIFSMDTSTSLAAERKATVAAVGGFLSTLESQGIHDYCIAVLLGHAVDQWAGSFYASGSNPKCLCAGTSNLISKFEQNLSDGPGEDVTDGGEANAYSFYQTFHDTPQHASKYTDNFNSGCFRDNAAKAFIPITDENDIGAATNGDPSSTCPQYNFSPASPVGEKPDAQCKESQARANYYSTTSGGVTKEWLTSQKIVNDFHAAFGSTPFYAAVVGYKDATYAHSQVGEDEDDPPYYLDTVASLTGGDFVDLKDATDGYKEDGSVKDPVAAELFNDSFNNLAGKLATAVNLNTVFHISDTACAGSILVKVDGTPKPYTYDGNKMVTLAFSDAGAPNSTIEISYNVCH